MRTGEVPDTSGYEDGWQHGLAKKYNKNGQLQREEVWPDGVREELFKEFDGKTMVLRSK